MVPPSVRQPSLREVDQLVQLVGQLRRELATATAAAGAREEQPLWLANVASALRAAAEELAGAHVREGAYLDRSTGDLRFQECPGCPTCREVLPKLRGALELIQAAIRPPEPEPAGGHHAKR